MADNTQVNVPTSAGDIIRTEEVAAGIKTQVVKLDIGGPGVDGPQVDASNPMPISAASLPLPTGAATAAAQGTGNTSLASIDTKTPALGQAAMAASSPVVVASNQTAIPISAASLPLPTGAATLAEQQTQTTALAVIAGDTTAIEASNAAIAADAATIAGDTTSIDGKTPALGQAAMAASVPVAIASDQSAVPISAAALPLPTGAATLAEQQTQTTALQIIDDWDESDRAKVNPIVGQAGVAAGSGTDSATTQRVSLATNVPLPAGTNNIGDVDVLTLPVQKYRQVYGTAQTVINTATDIAAGNFSGAPAATYDNTSDAAYPYAPLAVAMLEMPDWGAAPAAGTFVELWGVLQDTDGTDDDTDAPSGTSSGGAQLFGLFPVAAVDALQRRTITISVSGCQKINFYIKNGTAQNMNNDGGTNCVLKVTPLTSTMQV